MIIHQARQHRTRTRPRPTHKPMSTMPRRRRIPQPLTRNDHPAQPISTFPTTTTLGSSVRRQRMLLIRGGERRTLVVALLVGGYVRRLRGCRVRDRVGWRTTDDVGAGSGGVMRGEERTMNICWSTTTDDLTVFCQFRFDAFQDPNIGLVNEETPLLRDLNRSKRQNRGDTKARNTTSREKRTCSSKYACGKLIPLIAINKQSASTLLSVYPSEL